MVAGLALGAIATWWIAGLIGSLLYDIGPRDPRALAAAAAAVVLTSVIAAIVLRSPRHRGRSGSVVAPAVAFPQR